MHGFWADRQSSILGVPAAPVARKPLAEGGARRGPPVGGGSGAAGAAQTHKIGDFRSAQDLDVLKVIFNFVLGSPSSGGPGGGSGLPSSGGNRRFWADSRPNPEGNYNYNFHLDLKYGCVIKGLLP